MIGGPEHRGDTLLRVGAFRVLAVLGRGAAATVHLATQDGLDRRVALKQLTPGPLAPDVAFAQRFVQEARLVGRLSHPNVVTVFDYFETDGRAFIAMEYLARGSLRTFVGLLSTGQIIGVLDGVLAGLEYAERKGVVHRDLKPENLLVTDDGAVKIADFGIARLFDQVTNNALTADGTILGTPHYMAPEQVEGGELAPHTDLYALGIIAWELFAGRLPFDASINPHALLYRKVHQDVPSLAEARPDLDAGLVAWVAGLVARDPLERTTGAGCARERLDELAVELMGAHWRRDGRLPDEPSLDAAPLTGDAAVQVTSTPAPPPPTPITQIASAPGGRRLSVRRAPRAMAAAIISGAALAGLTVALAGQPDGARTTSQRSTTAAASAQTAAYLDAVAVQLRRLATARADGISAMSTTRSRRRQAQAASDVSDAYAAATAALRRLDAPARSASAATTLVARLARTSRDYQRIGRAARSQTGAAYRAAARTAGEDERLLNSLLDRQGIIVDLRSAD